MNFKILIIVLFASASALAAQPDLVGQLKAKGIRCDLTQEQLRDQLTAQLDLNIRSLDETLRGRGSEVESIIQDRNQVEVGVLPKPSVLDLYILEKVSVVIQKLNFPVQTTYYTDNSAGPEVATGLWFPLQVLDPGKGKPCTLKRVSFRPENQKFAPVVDLVIGEPPRVVAKNIVQVMDSTEALQAKPDVKQEVKPEVKPEAKQETKPEATQEAKPEATQEAKPESKKEVKPETQPAEPGASAKAEKAERSRKPAVQRDEDEKPSRKVSRSQSRREARREARELRRQERREQRREEREERRRESRRRHRRNRSEDAEQAKPSATTAPPAKSSGCSGDDSMWKSAACTLGIIK